MPKNVRSDNYWVLHTGYKFRVYNNNLIEKQDERKVKSSSANRIKVELFNITKDEFWTNMFKVICNKY